MGQALDKLLEKLNSFPDGTLAVISHDQLSALRGKFELGYGFYALLRDSEDVKAVSNFKDSAMRNEKEQLSPRQYVLDKYENIFLIPISVSNNQHLFFREIWNQPNVEDLRDIEE